MAATSARRALPIVAALALLLPAPTALRPHAIPLQPQPNDCATSADCRDTSQYCARPDGACDHAERGTCQARPAVCPEAWAPVCGCDGRTYENRCFAQGAGQNVAHEGACDDPPPEGCETNADCAVPGVAGRVWCAKEPGDCDGAGTCAPRPEACIDLYDPVCGCDGRTWGNACHAAAAGVNVAREGECGSPPPPDGP